MNDTGTGVFGNPRGTEHLEAAIGSSLLKEAKEWLVALADKGFSLELLKNGVTILN